MFSGYNIEERMLPMELTEAPEDVLKALNKTAIKADTFQFELQELDQFLDATDEV